MRINTKQARELGIVPAPKQPKQKAAEDRRARERLITEHCRAMGLPEPLFEYPFAAPERAWRFDLLFDGWLALEIQGGLYTGGRHVRGQALQDEYEKLNEAQIMGYTTLLVTPQQIDSGEAFALVGRALQTQ